MKVIKKEEKTPLIVTGESTEKDSVTILKSLWEAPDTIIQKSKKATFFVNLVYVIGLFTYIAMILNGDVWAALPSLGLITVEVFIINVLIYSITKSAKQQKDAAYSLYMNYEYRRTNGQK